MNGETSDAFSRRELSASLVMLAFYSRTITRVCPDASVLQRGFLSSHFNQAYLPSSPCPRVRLDSWVSPCAQHTSLRIDDDGGAGRKGPRWCNTQLVTARDEFLLRRFGDALLHRHVARNHGVWKRRRWEAASGPPWSFDGLLDVHAKIDHVDQCLHGDHHLVVAARTSGNHERLAVLHH